MLIGGILGPLILPTLSDKMKMRKPFMVVYMIFMLPGLISLTVFNDFVSTRLKESMSKFL